MAFASSGPALGSWWAGAPVAGIVALLVLRAAREDEVPRARMPGYREYAERTRWRLPPGAW